MTSVSTLITLALSATLAAPAAAQSSPKPATPDPLSGPAVDDENAGPTIVERTFDGNLKRLEIRPEEAALAKLNLTPEERTAADAVLSERAKTLDAIVREHIDLLVRQQAARAGGNNDEIAKVNKEFREAMRPLASRGGLGAELAATLEEPNARRYNRMVREYYAALLSQSRKEMPEGDPVPDGMMDGDVMRDDTMAPKSVKAKPEPRRAEAARQLLEVFGQEVRRSYDRIAAEGQSRLDDVVKRLALDTEQEARVRAIATEFAQKSLLNPTPAQRAEVFRKVLAELTPEQRAKALNMLRN